MGCESDRERDGLQGPVRTVSFLAGVSLLAKPNQEVTVTYGRHGWRTEQVVVDSALHLITKTVYRHDLQSRSIEAFEITPNGQRGTKLVTTCDPEHKAVTTKTFDQQDSLVGWKVETIAENGRVEKAILYYGDGQVRHKSDFKYDKDGRRIEAMEWDPHGPDETRVAFKYDSNDRIIEEISMNLDGSVRGITRLTYKLDSHGNWVERTSQLCSPRTRAAGELVCDEPLTEKRTITYYEDGP